MIVCGIILLFNPENGLMLVALTLGFAFMVFGVRTLVYYVTMARHMVGGLALLFIAVIVIDIGSLALALINDPRLSIALYLIVYNAFMGVLAIARGVEAKMFGSPWVGNIVHGIVNLALAAACIAFLGSDQIIIGVFCIGLFYSAGVRLVSAFKPTEIIYIQ